MSSIIIKRNRINDRVRIILLLSFLISHASIFLTSIFAYYDYIASIIIFVIILASGFTILNYDKSIIILLITISLIGGICASYLLQIGNDSYFLTGIIIVNSLMYLLLISSQKAYINEIDVSKLFDFLIAFGIISSLYNLYQNWGSMRSLSISTHAYYGAIFSSFYGGRNAFAFCLYVYTVITIYQIYKTKKKAYYFAAGLFLLNLFFTFSRTAIISTTFAVGLFMFLRSRRSGIQRLGFIVLSIILLVLAIQVFLQNEDYLSHFLIRSDYKDAYRTTYWKEAFSNLWLSPIFGFGAGSATNILEGLENIAGSSFHNTYIEIIMWGGIVLIVAYCLLLRTVIVAIKKIKSFDIVFYHCYSSFLFSFLINCLFETSMFFALGYRGHFITIVVFLIPVLYSKEEEALKWIE